LGESINDGVKNGIIGSASDMEDTLRSEIFDMLATQLVTVSGFEDALAGIAEDIWNELTPGAKEKKELQDAMASLLTQVDPSELGWTQSDLNSWFASLSSASTKTLDDTVAKFKNAIGLIERYGGDSSDLELLVNLVEMQKQLNGIEIGIGTIDQSTIDAAGDSIQQYIDMIQSLKEAIGITSEDITSETDDLFDSIKQSLVSAALTGSFSDFKNAIYNKIVSNITEAVMESAIVGDRIQAIMNQILDAGMDFDSTDAQAVFAEIKNIWADVTDENTPLGSIMMGLRDALGDFGLLDINVNPGSIVTAIPSDVRDDLIAAIENSIDLLVDAISSAGLNSHIDIVNITTAYITSMTANTISIQQANLNMSGSMIFQVANGSSFNDFLESWMADYLARSAP
jgi:hypothetical protein